MVCPFPAPPVQLCRQYTDQFLQYMAARFAPSAAVHSFELFNEVDGVQTYVETQVTTPVYPTPQAL